MIIVRGCLMLSVRVFSRRMFARLRRTIYLMRAPQTRASDCVGIQSVSEYLWLSFVGYHMLILMIAAQPDLILHTESPEVLPHYQKETFLVNNSCLRYAIKVKSNQRRKHSTGYDLNSERVQRIVFHASTDITERWGGRITYAKKTSTTACWGKSRSQ